MAKSNKELQDEIDNSRALFIADVMRCLKSDPDANDGTKNYKELPQYLSELIDKDGSLMGGLIIAIEHYLEK